MCVIKRHCNYNYKYIISQMCQTLRNPTLVVHTRLLYMTCRSYITTRMNYIYRVDKKNEDAVG